jgi:hypothetical protein
MQTANDPPSEPVRPRTLVPHLPRQLADPHVDRHFCGRIRCRVALHREEVVICHRSEDRGEDIDFARSGREMGVRGGRGREERRGGEKGRGEEDRGVEVGEGVEDEVGGFADRGRDN